MASVRRRAFISGAGLAGGAAAISPTPNASQPAAGAARAFARTGDCAWFDSVAEARRAEFGQAFRTVRVEGYYAPGDGGAALWRATKTRPPHPGALRLGDQWFEIAGDWITPNMLGARQDGVADDSDPVEAADAAAVALGVPLRLRGGRHPYSISRGVKLSGATDVEFCQGQLLYRGAPNSPALQIGDAAHAAYSRKFSDLDVRSAEQSDWSSSANVGIRIVRANQCVVTVRSARGFTVGLELSGDNGGCAHNDLTLQEIANNQCGVECTSSNGGWCNENIIRNGRYMVETGVNPGKPRCGLRIRSASTPAGYNNAIVLDKPSFELNRAYGQAVAIIVEHGHYCRIRDARDEGNDVFLRVLNDSRYISGNVLVSSGPGHRPVVENRGRFKDAATVAALADS